MKAKDVEAAAAEVNESLEHLSNLLSGEVPDKYLAPLQDLSTRVAKVAATIQTTVKGRVKTLVEAQGRVFTVAGSKVYDLAGWRMEIRPTGGGLDMDRLGAVLRAKGVKRIEYCDVEKVYTPNAEKIQQLIGAKKLKQSEYDECLKEKSFSVYPANRIPEVQDE